MRNSDNILPRGSRRSSLLSMARVLGLGLSISQSYVRSHGGDIQVESIPGSGTTIRITLPIRQANKGVPQHSEEVIA